MDSSRLEHLLKVIECGSITKASEELGYTQSGISHMVKALEKEFGFPLFARGRSGVEPTEDCKRIIPAIRQIVRWNEQLGQLTADIRGLTVGTVRVGTFTSVSVHWLPKILKRFQTQHPQVKIDLVEGAISLWPMAWKTASSMWPSDADRKLWRRTGSLSFPIS